MQLVGIYGITGASICDSYDNFIVFRLCQLACCWSCTQFNYTAQKETLCIGTFFTVAFECSIKQLWKLAFCDKTKKYDTVFLVDITSLSGKCIKSKKANRMTVAVGEIEHSRLCGQWCLQIIMYHNYSLQKLELGCWNFHHVCFLWASRT